MENEERIDLKVAIIEKKLTYNLFLTNEKLILGTDGNDNVLQISFNDFLGVDFEMKANKKTFVIHTTAFSTGCCSGGAKDSRVLLKKYYDFKIRIAYLNEKYCKILGEK